MAGDLDLPDGYTLQWCAIDANGANVANVRVSNVSLFGTMLGAAGTAGGASGGELVGPYMLVPGPQA